MDQEISLKKIQKSSSTKRVKFKRELEQTIYLRNQYKQYQGLAFIMTVAKCQQNRKFYAFMKLSTNANIFERKTDAIRLIDLIIKKKDKMYKNIALMKIKHKAYQYNYALRLAKKLACLQNSKKLELKRVFFTKIHQNIFRSQFRCRFPKHKTKTELFPQQLSNYSLIKEKIEDPQNNYQKCRQILSKSGYNSPIRAMQSKSKLFSPSMRINTEQQSFADKIKQIENLKLINFSQDTKAELLKLQKYNKQKYLQQLPTNIRQILSQEIKKLDKLKLSNKLFSQKPNQDQILLKILNNAIKLIVQLNTEQKNQNNNQNVLSRGRVSSTSSSMIIQRNLSTNLHTGSMTNLDLLNSKNIKNINRELSLKQFQNMKNNIKKQLQTNNILYAKNQIKIFLKKYSQDIRFKEQLMIYQYLHNYLIQNQKINKCLDDNKKIIQKLSNVDLQKSISTNIQTLKGVKRQCNIVMNRNAPNIQQDDFASKAYQIAKKYQKNAEDYMTLLQQKGNSNSNLSLNYSMSNRNLLRNNQTSPTIGLHKRINSGQMYIDLDNQKNLKIKQLQKKLKDYQEKVNKANIEIKSLSNDIQIIKNQKLRFQQIVNEKQQTIKQLKKQFNNLSPSKNQISSLQKQIQKILQQSSQKNFKIKSLQQKHKQQGQKMKRIDNLFEKSQKQIYQLQKKQLALKQEILQIKIQLNKQRNEKDDIQQQLQILNSKQSQSFETIQKDKRKIFQLNQKNKLMMDTNDRLTDIITEQAQRYKKLDLKYKQLQQMYTQKLNKQSQKFLEDMSFEASTKQDIFNNQRTIDQTKRNLDQILFQNKLLGEELTQQKKINQNLRNQKANVQKEIFNLKSNNHSTSSYGLQSKHSSQSYSSEQRQVMKSTLNQYNLLKQRLNSTQQSLYWANKKIQQFKQDIKAQQIHAGKLIIQNRKIKDQLQQWKGNHIKIIQQQVKKALKVQQMQVNQFLRKNDTQRNAYIENILLPQKKKEWQMSLQCWIDNIIKQEQKYWEEQFKKKYRIQQ